MCRSFSKKKEHSTGIALNTFKMGLGKRRSTKIKTKTKTKLRIFGSSK
jgi:hypothetical protein